MAKFKIILDTRTKMKDGKYNLTVRMTNKEDVMYLNVSKLTKAQYHDIFERNLMDEKSIEFRNSCNLFIAKCERLFLEIQPFNKEKFRQRFYEKDREIPAALFLDKLFDYYIEKSDIKIKTKQHYKTTSNVLMAFRSNLVVQSITPELLKEFEKSQLKQGCSIATVNSHLRNLRSVINYFTLKHKLIPRSYQYPFGYGGYSIKNYFPKKSVLSQKEIEQVIGFSDFDSAKQEWARDVWLLCFRSSGINFIDLLRLRWDHKKNGCFVFFRTKTETTRRNNVKEIIVPITDRVQTLLDKVGDRTSPFVLGKLKEGYSETTLNNLVDRLKKLINRELSVISKKLSLTVELKLKSARDCYATSLKRNGTPTDQIGEMLGHSNPSVTQHYLASLDLEKVFEINNSIL